MGVQFSVDYQQLTEMGDTLVRLKNEFETIDDRVEGHERATGPEVADALDTFATNWSDKRQQIAGMIDGVAIAVAMAAGAYEQSETEICHGFDDAGAG
ncbi:MAG: hypothetical protein ACRD29_16150 [Acidimicrobiales bacterium]